MASQGRVHPNCSTAEAPINALVHQQQQQQQQRSVQLQQQAAAQAVVQQVVQAQLAAVPVGQLVAGQGVAALQQQMQQQHVNKAREDSQNYMIQQLQKKEQQRSTTSAVATASQQQQQQGGALKCGHCEYTCDHKDIMLGHLGAHADVLPFICSKCGLANKWHHTAWIHLQQVGNRRTSSTCEIRNK